MTSTLVGYFDDYSQARSTEQDLIAAGFGSDAVQVVRKETTGTEARGALDETWWDRFKTALGADTEQDRTYYQRAADRGGALVTVRVADDQTDRAAEIIERHHPTEIEPQGGAEAGAAPARSQTAGPTSESTNVPVTEEELQVGRRIVPRGAVRIHTYVTEHPVEEQIDLREQRAFAERRPVDRDAKPGEDAFQERTLEVREFAEEAVASKKARVVAEVRVGKEQTSRTETVRDSVRKTEVEVDNEPGRGRD